MDPRDGVEVTVHDDGTFTTLGVWNDWLDSITDVKSGD